MSLEEIKEGLTFIRDTMESKNEFEAILEDHEIEETKFYRLRYMNYSRDNDEKINTVDWPFDYFELPENMVKEEAFKVLSYLTDYIEKTFNLEECTKLSVSYLNDVLNIERLGFKKIDNIGNEKVTDLFSIGGRVMIFKSCPEYEKYFEWYTCGISLNEVQYIYEKYGMDFYDLSLDEIEEQRNNKVRLLNNQKQ